MLTQKDPREPREFKSFDDSPLNTGFSEREWNSDDLYKPRVVMRDDDIDVNEGDEINEWDNWEGERFD